jgi:hypothetical protein
MVRFTFWQLEPLGEKLRYLSNRKLWDIKAHLNAVGKRDICCTGCVET